MSTTSAVPDHHRMSYVTQQAANNTLRPTLRSQARPRTKLPTLQIPGETGALQATTPLYRKRGQSNTVKSMGAPGSQVVSQR